MRKPAITIFTAIAGAVGAVMRKYELNTVFDSATGLAERNAPVSIFLIALSVFVAVVLLVFTTREGRTGRLGYLGAFGHNSVLLFMLISFLGILIALAGIIQAIVLGVGGVLLIQDIVWTILVILSGVGVFLMPLMMWIGKKRKQWPLATIIPVVLMCFWLIFTYMGQVSNPVLLDYVYELFAVGFAILGYYYAAGFMFGREQPRKMIFCSQMAVYFTAVTMADGHTIYEKGILLALMLTLMIKSMLLIRNMNAYIEPAATEPASAPEEQVDIDDEYLNIDDDYLDRIDEYLKMIDEYPNIEDE